MDQKFSKKEEKEQMDKARKNLVYVSMLSIIMLFGGLTSAYIVSMGDSFWLKVPFPTAFWLSTIIIGFGSVFIQLSIFFAKKGKVPAMKTAILITFILGVLFIYFQFKGYGQLVEKGVQLSNSILVSNGKYGDDFKVKYKDNFIQVDGNDFLVKGEKMNNVELRAYKDFMSQFLNSTKPFNVNQYGNDFEIFQRIGDSTYKLLIVIEEKFSSDSLKKYSVFRENLRYLAENVRDSRGDFFVKGKVGEDFQLYYKGKELQYKNRIFYINGQELNKYDQKESMKAADTASSFLWVITFMHLLHVIVTMFYVLKLVIHTFIGKINQQDNLTLKMGAIFWHFLGLLWLYLLLFLLYIH